MIQLQNVTKIYALGKGSTVTAVHDLSLDFSPGEFAIIVGRSGSGKTTLLNLAAGLTRPTSGRILFDRMDLQELSDQQRSQMRNRKIGFVFQFPSLLPTLTVLENVILPTGFASNHHGQVTTRTCRPATTDLALFHSLRSCCRNTRMI